MNTQNNGYAEERALIEDLQARYMFALDFGDIDTYVATFTEDGVLDIGEGEWCGRETIKQRLLAIPKREEPQVSAGAPALRPARGRHNIANIVLKIDGNKAWGRAYWFHMGNENPERSAVLNSYGHYVDELVKVNDAWFFSKRRIYNEQEARWAWQGDNPCW